MIRTFCPCCGQRKIPETGYILARIERRKHIAMLHAQAEAKQKAMSDIIDILLSDDNSQNSPGGNTHGPRPN